MNPPPILIAGGGIAGLAAALACRSHDCLIMEQAKAFSQIGAGLQLGPNAVRALQKLGAWDAVEAVTNSPPAIHMRDGLTGKTLKVLTLGETFEKRYDAPYRTALRADLHKALLECVLQQKNLDVRLTEKITTIAAHLDHVAVDVNGTPRTCQTLIAADGVNSSIRTTLFPKSTAINSGFNFHRALLPVSGFDAPAIAFDCVNVWMFPHGHVVHYPVSNNERLNLVAIAPHGENVAAHYAKACAPMQNLLQQVSEQWTVWPGLYAPPLPSWTIGGILLLGDAAHGTLPFLAQGAAMALEDAACLHDVLKTTHSLNHAFTETAARRMARTKRLQEASLRAGKIYHASGALRFLRNAALTATPPSQIMAGLDWLYRG